MNLQNTHLSNEMKPSAHLRMPIIRFIQKEEKQKESFSNNEQQNHQSNLGHQPREKNSLKDSKNNSKRNPNNATHLLRPHSQTSSQEKRKSQQQKNQSQAPKMISMKRKSNHSQCNTQPINPSTKTSVLIPKSTIKMAIELPFSKQVLNAEGSMVNGKVILKGRMINLDHDLVDQQVRKLQKCLHQAISFLQKFDLLTPIQTINKMEIKEITEAQINRLIMGFSFFNEEIPSISENQLKSVERVLTSNCPVLITEIEKIRNTHKVSLLTAFYVLIQVLSREGKLNPYKLLSSLGNYAKTSQILKDFSLCLSNSSEQSMKYHNFILEERMQFVRWFKTMLEKKRVELDEKLGKSGVQKMFLSILDFKSYACYNSVYSMNNERKPIEYLNQTLKQIVSSIGFYYDYLTYFEKKKEKLIVKSIHQLLCEIQKGFGGFANLCNIQQLRDELYQIYFIPLCQQYAQLKRNNKQNQLQVKGPWNLLIRYFDESKSERQLKMRANPKQRERELIAIIKVIDFIPNITANLDNLVLLQNKVCLLHSQDYLQLTISEQFPRQETLEFFILLKLFQKYQFNKHKAYKTKSHHLSFAKKPQQHQEQQTQAQIQEAFNKQFNQLINSVLTSKKLLQIALLLFYVNFNQQPIKSKIQTYILNVDPIHICSVLNSFVRKDRQLSSFDKVSQQFMNEMFGNNTTINQIRKDELFINCFKIFEDPSLQLTQKENKGRLFNLERYFLQGLNIIFQKVGSEIESLKLNKEDKQGKIIQIFKKLADEEKPTLQELKQRYYVKQYLKDQKQEIKTSDVLVEKVLYEFNVKFMRKVFKTLGDKLSPQRDKQNHKLIKNILKNIYSMLIEIHIDKLNSKKVFEQHQWTNRILQQQKLMNIISDEYRKMLIDDKIRKWKEKSDREKVFSELFLLFCDITNCHLFMIDGEMIINKRQSDPIVVLLRVRKAWLDLKNSFAHPKFESMLNKVFPLEDKPSIEGLKTSLTYVNLILSKVILPSLGDCQFFPISQPIIEQLISLMSTLKEKFIDQFRLDEFTASHVLEVVYSQVKAKKQNGNDIEMQQTIVNQTALQCFKFLDYLLQFETILMSSNLPHSNQMLRIIPKDTFPSKILSQISQNLLLIQFLNLVNSEELFKKYKAHKKIGLLIEVQFKFTIKQRSKSKIWQQILNQMDQKERQQIQNYVKKDVCKNFLDLKKTFMNQQNRLNQTNNLRNFFSSIPLSRLIELIKVIHRLSVKIYRNPEQQKLLSVDLSNKSHDQKFIKDIKVKSKIHRLEYIGVYANVLKLQSLPLIMNNNISVNLARQKQNRMGQLTQICENFTSFFLQQIQTMVQPFEQFTIVKKYGLELINELGIISALQCIQKYKMHIKSLIIIIKFLALNIFINDILYSHIDQNILDEANERLESVSMKIIRQMNEKIENEVIQQEKIATFQCVGFVLLIPLMNRTKHIDNWLCQRNILSYYSQADMTLDRIQQILSNQDNSISKIILRLQSIQYSQSKDKQFIQMSQKTYVFGQLFQVMEYFATKYFTELSQWHIPNFSDHRWEMSKKVEKQISQRFSTEFLEPSTCCTLTIFLSYYLTIFNESLLFKRCAVNERRLFRILTHFLNIMQINYEFLVTNLDPAEFKTQIVSQHLRMYQQLFDRIQILKCTFSHFASQTKKSQEEEIEGKESIYSDLFIYTTKIIKDYDEKRKKQKDRVQIGVEFPIHKKVQNPPKFHSGYQIMTYSRLSKVLQTRKLKREHQFDQVFMMLIQGVRKLPQVKLLIQKQTIRGFNLMQEFLNCFILFLQNNQKFRPSSQGLIEPFYQVFGIIDYWEVMINQMKFEEIEMYLLAYLKFITQISIIMRKIIGSMKIKVQEKQTFRQVQTRVNQSVHIFLVRVLSSEVLSCFGDFTVENESKDKKMIRYLESKIVYTSLIDLIRLTIDKKLINRELLEKPLYEFKYSNQMCKRAKNTKLDQSNLVGLIEISIIKPLTILISTGNTFIRIQKDNKHSFDRLNVEKIIENQKIIMNANKEGYDDMLHLAGSEMSYFQFIDCLTTLEIGEKFINTIKSIMKTVKKQHPFWGYLAMDSNHIKRILRNAKTFYCTFSNPPYDLKMEKVQFKEYCKNLQKKLAQIISTLRKFIYNGTQMRIQIHCFLFNGHKSMKISKISSIIRSVVKTLSNYQDLNETTNKQLSYDQSQSFTEICNYFTADEIKANKKKAERRKEERYKIFERNLRMEYSSR